MWPSHPPPRPSYILEGDDPATGASRGRVNATLWPPVLEYTLSWLGALEYGAANVVNFVVEPITRRDPATNTTSMALYLPSHVNAQGDYARRAAKLLDALLPDLTDTVAGPAFGVAVVRSSRCTSAGALPAPSGRPALNFSSGNASTVVAKGLRQRWGRTTQPAPPTSVTNGTGAFCGFVVVANLCAAPTSYTLSIETSTPLAWHGVTHAEHVFDASYTVPLEQGPGRGLTRVLDEAGKLGRRGAMATQQVRDIVPGYATSVTSHCAVPANLPPSGV